MGKKEKVIVRELPPKIKEITPDKNGKEKTSVLEKEVVEAEQEQTQQFFVNEGFVPSGSFGTTETPEQRISEQRVREVERETTALTQERQDVEVVYADNRRQAIRMQSSYVQAARAEGTINPSLEQERDIFREPHKATPFRGMGMESTQMEKKYEETIGDIQPEKPKRRYPWEVA